MVDENTVAAKSILKRRVRNDVKASAAEEQSRDGSANACKRIVTFDETITVKNEKDLVIKKPMKLELVIEHWKSSGEGGDDGGTKTNPGIVRRLVGEFNAVPDPLTTDNHPELDCASLPEEDKRGEDQPTAILQNDSSLCEALETRTAKLTNGKCNLLDRCPNRGRVNDLINMYNSKSTSNCKTELAGNKLIDF